MLELKATDFRSSQLDDILSIGKAIHSHRLGLLIVIIVIVSIRALWLLGAWHMLIVLTVIRILSVVTVWITVLVCRSRRGVSRILCISLLIISGIIRILVVRLR